MRGDGPCCWRRSSCWSRQSRCRPPMGCTCARGGDPRERLAAADGAFIGQLVSRRETGPLGSIISTGRDVQAADRGRAAARRRWPTARRSGGGWGLWGGAAARPGPPRPHPRLRLWRRRHDSAVGLPRWQPDLELVRDHPKRSRLALRELPDSAWCGDDPCLPSHPRSTPSR
jgi:hypothetical protein